MQGALTSEAVSTPDSMGWTLKVILAGPHSFVTGSQKLSRESPASAHALAWKQCTANARYSCVPKVPSPALM
jgi:hypothetical protein